MKIPVLGVNSINDPHMAESILDQGYCDIVDEPLLPGRPGYAQQGQGGEDARIRPCIRCMQGCVTSTYLQIPMRCCVNPEMNREYLYTFADQPAPKKVLVVGGGPAGMQAAIAAARRGHDVTLWEKSDALGGQFIAAAYPPGKGRLCHLHLLYDQRTEGAEGEKGGEEQGGHRRRSARLWRRQGDPRHRRTAQPPPDSRASTRDNVYFAEDILRGRVLPEGRILVAGGGEVGVETAMHLADAERGEITVVEMTGGICAGADGTRVVAMKKFLQEREVDLLLNTKVLEFCANGVLLEQKGRIRLFPCDHVVVSMGYHPNNALAEELKALGDKLTVVGDAVKCANAMEAGVSGFEAGYYA